LNSFGTTTNIRSLHFPRWNLDIAAFLSRGSKFIEASSSFEKKVRKPPKARDVSSCPERLALFSNDPELRADAHALGGEELG